MAGPVLAVLVPARRSGAVIGSADPGQHEVSQAVRMRDGFTRADEQGGDRGHFTI